METIQLLDPPRYLGPLTRGDGVSAALLAGDRTSALTHDGWVMPRGASERVHAVLKVYRDSDGTSRELLNEVIGHHLAASLDYPVPQLAGTVEIMRDAWPNLAQWSELQADASSAVAWWTSVEPERSVRARYHLDVLNRRSPLLGKFVARARVELSKSKDVPGIIAFDELIANVDRNIGNILGPRGLRYVLIDHGRCLTGPHWIAKDLDPARCYHNTLMALIDWDNQSLTTKSTAAAVIAHIAPQLPEPLVVLEAWLAGIIEPDEVGAVLAFLKQRCLRDPAAVRLGLIA